MTVNRVELNPISGASRGPSDPVFVTRARGRAPGAPYTSRYTQETVETPAGTRNTVRVTRVFDTPAGIREVTPRADQYTAEETQRAEEIANPTPETPPPGGGFGGNFGGGAASSIIPAAIGGGEAGFATGNNCTGCASTGRGFGPGTGFDPTAGPGAIPGLQPNVVPPEELLNDPEWQAELANLKREFPELDEQELYRIIQGESRFNTRAYNASSGATGLFQFIPSTAAGLGTSTAEIQNMSPAQQLQVYGRYLRQSNYQGGPLGMIQAAPGTYRNLIAQYGSWDRVPRNIEVYRYGGAAWQQNPGWRDQNGRVTVGGIEAYYAKQS